jgi:hypothetical protein
MSATSLLVEQIRSGTAARNLKEFAAQGMLPLPPEELIPVQVFLSKDEDEQIAAAALKSLAGVSDDLWIKIVEKKDPDSEIVAFCLQHKPSNFALKEKILLNQSVSDDVITQIAGTDSGSMLDIIINNQVRLLRSPAILTALEKNPNLTRDQSRRIEEFKTEFIFKKQQPAHPTLEDISQISYDDILAQIPQLDLEARKIIEEIDRSPQKRLSEEEVQQVLKNLFSTDELSTLPADIVSTYQKILKMKHSEKIRVALLGSREERGLLIRDPSRQVASLVLRSPKLTESEIDGFAQMRNLDSDILRQLGQNREFIKRYTVAHSLVRNPKTPSPVALNLLRLLRDTDLRNLERDRNIPEIIRRQSKKIREMKEVQKDRRS